MFRAHSSDAITAEFDAVSQQWYASGPTWHPGQATEDTMILLLDFLSYLVLSLLVIPGLFEFLRSSGESLVPGG
ncbi:MAG: hypothetical protein JXA69_10520 [Phycisphaerae bacterium]|nr:hypothetical protein [Phycisphaerae bacterium]